MNGKWLRCVLAVSTMLFLGAAFPAGAEVAFGLRASAWLEDTDPAVGAEWVIPLGTRLWYLNPNFEAVFGERNDRLVGNVDVHYDFFQTSDLTVWAGAGLAWIHNQDPRRDQDDDEAGANLLAGIGWKGERVLPYAQLKAVLAGDSELVASVGVRF